MLWIDADNAAEHLRRFGHVPPDAPLEVEELPGGVSNQVLRVRYRDRRAPDFVLKQARPQLRTPIPWFCGVERIWREIDVLHVCGRVVDPEQVPTLLWVEWENYLFAMSAAPADHRTWKQELLAGKFDPQRAAACGRLLGRIHAATWLDRPVALKLHDRRLFHQLRLDPYFGTVARAHPRWAPKFDALVRSLLDHARALVHADFTPKNLLVFPEGMTLVDFETGHFGDPAFDVGLFLAHLVLKGFYHAPEYEPMLRLGERFWEAYAPALRERAGGREFGALEARAVRCFAGCVWARIDGTSQVDYLDDERRRDAVRHLARYLLTQEPPTWDDALDACRARLQTV